MDGAGLFRRHAIASPHHLASAAGAQVLLEGGNAMDAAIAANLVLAVVTPYYCGVGGDLLAIVHDGSAHGVMSVGRAPATSARSELRAAVDLAAEGCDSIPGTDGMPKFGALAVTVPGATAGWFHLLEGWGSRAFGDLARQAVELAESGFVVSKKADGYAKRSRQQIGDQPGWGPTFGSMQAGERLRQPDLGRTLRTLGSDGPAALYGGAIGKQVVATLQSHGSPMTIGDFTAHEVSDVKPIVGRFRDVEVLQLPPPTQGLTALTALGILDELGPADPDLAVHLHRQIEAVRAAMADRRDYLGDPEAMGVTAAALIDRPRLRAMAAAIDDRRARDWPPSRPLPGGTAYICAADDSGLVVSLIQSNFQGFGSGVVPEGTGISLHDRGAQFRLAPGHPASLGPERMPMHTLIPGLVLRQGQPWLVFGTMGADGQPQTHLQVLSQILDGDAEPWSAIAAPRFIVDVADGSVSLESRFGEDLFNSLAARGHRVRMVEGYADLAGHAHAIRMDQRGFLGASDPRSEGAVTGL